MSDRARWQFASPWPEASDDAGSDIVVRRRDAVALATIIVRPGQEPALEDLLATKWGCALPTAGTVVSGPDVTLVWSAPRQWLAVASRDGALNGLSDALAGIAALTDQSDSRALVEISGPKAGEALARGFAIDLHVKSFPARSSAVTKVAHISVQLWRTDETPTFVIAVPRSLAGSFWTWLQGARASFGGAVSGA